MPPASAFLLFGVVVATVLCSVAWWRARVPRRSPLRSVDDFNVALRALSPGGTRRRDR
ncbi:MAG: hypothetical protein WDA27_10540 [Actinomycetota bacterium]